MQYGFPLGVAKGKAFCNRVNERKHLKHNILHGEHTLIISPRRYGKTSLALQAIAETKCKTAIMEFTLATDKRAVQKIMSTAIGQLLYQLMPTPKKALALAAKYFAKLHPNIIDDARLSARVHLQLDPSSSHLGFTELLAGIDSAAAAVKKRVVLLFDEVQQLAALEDHQTIEAELCNVVKNMQHVSIIFTGSHRHALQLMFHESSRPLHQLADTMVLARIDEADYIDYLQHAAQLHWHKKLAMDVISEIFHFSQRHPYYMNVLCSRLWREQHLPTLKMTEKIWHHYIEEERSRLRTEISQLSHHQRLMMMILSQEPFKQPTSKEIVMRMRASVGSVAKSFNVLLENDYIYQAENGFYRILDPALAYYLQCESDVVLG